MTATAGFDLSHRRLHQADSPRPGVVVRLHREAPLRPPSSGSHTSHSGSGHPVAADLDQLTRAVHALGEALAPGVVAEVSVLEAGPAGALAPQPPAGEHAPDLVGDDQIRLDRLSRTLLVDGVPVPLTKREFELLAHLAQYQGIAMSRRELMNAVWHERYLPGDRTVDVHIRRVRVQLGVYADRLNTLRGYGYRFD